MVEVAWLRPFLKCFAVVTIVLFAAYWFKGYTFTQGLYSAVVWSFISSAVFMAVRWYHQKTGAPCAVCDEPMSDKENT